ncbi:hypothetical protein LOTGIDRAFT_197181 [Lottia gigantea]|uniref:EF-hand domain-containing protein n=1 Tax=Lottia gigantea TaxID=225164 RepID=V3ZRJ6_LOTGI|nr:hypothetical protein LOTGIDRAFT_197181 [Lottia gigantea]ESO83501.1 hypothetical protein LOTGIDRAFT_197181 [Lottia gigantea]
MSQAEITEAFKLFDSDGDGYIPPNEIGTAVRALGHIITDTDLYNMMKKLGVGGRGVDFNTYRKMVDSLKGANYARQLKEAFATIDRESSGYVVATELRTMLTRLGDKLTDDEFEVLLQELDVDRNGRIRTDDFIHLICSSGR